METSEQRAFRQGFNEAILQAASLTNYKDGAAILKLYKPSPDLKSILASGEPIADIVAMAIAEPLREAK